MKSLEIEYFSGPFSLSGQIDYPDGDGPFPVVLIVPGMAQHNRDGNASGYPGYNNYYLKFAKVILNAGGV